MKWKYVNQNYSNNFIISILLSVKNYYTKGLESVILFLLSTVIKSNYLHYSLNYSAMLIKY